MRTVVFVVFDDFQLLDLAGPVDVSRGATEVGAVPPYRTLVASADGRSVRSGSGVEIGVDASLTQLRRRRFPIDGVVVVGGGGADHAADDPDLCRDVAALSRRARRSVDVEPDQIYVHDGDVWTSAGVTAGIDLFLALVDADHGAKLAHRIARDLVVFVRRPGGQSQFSAQLRAEPARSPAIAELQRWLPDHLDDDVTVAALARRTGMSQRHFARAFAAEVGTGTTRSNGGDP